MPLEPHLRRSLSKTRRHAARRQQLLDVARGQITRFGLSALTVEGVAREAALSKAAVFYYFRSKEALLAALAALYLREEVEVCLTAAREAKSAIDALCAVVSARVLHFVRHPEAHQVLYGLPAAKLGLLPLASEVATHLESRLASDGELSALGRARHVHLVFTARLLADGLLSQSLRGAAPSTVALVRQVEALLPQLHTTLRHLAMS